MLSSQQRSAPATTVIVVALQLSATAAFAQAGQATNGAKRAKSPAQIEMETYYQKLGKPISLPDVPEISGHAKFRFGLERTEKTGLTSVGLRYGTNSTPQQVIDFYKQSLLASRWKLTMASSTSLQANKSDKRLCINIMPKGSPEVATDFMVSYSYKGR